MSKIEITTKFAAEIENSSSWALRVEQESATDFDVDASERKWEIGRADSAGGVAQSDCCQLHDDDDDEDDAIVWLSQY